MSENMKLNTDDSELESEDSVERTELLCESKDSVSVMDKLFTSENSSYIPDQLVPIEEFRNVPFSSEKDAKTVENSQSENYSTSNKSTENNQRLSVNTVTSSKISTVELNDTQELQNAPESEDPESLKDKLFNGESDSVDCNSSKRLASPVKVDKIVFASIKKLKRESGSTLKEIKQYIALNCDVDVPSINQEIKDCLKDAVTNGVLVKTDRMRYAFKTCPKKRRRRQKPIRKERKSPRKEDDHPNSSEEEM